MGKMRGLVAIVTGASRGLGRAIAREYAREGAKVVICARPQSPSGLLGTIQETAELIRSDGGKVLPIPCDVTSQEQVEGLVRQVMARYERIDVLFNNAGIMVLYRRQSIDRCFRWLYQRTVGGIRSPSAVGASGGSGRSPRGGRGRG